MHELLRSLATGSMVLDLGCAGGSFDSRYLASTVVRFDLERPSPRPSNFVQGDAAKLPFAEDSFKLVISNHSLEHVENLAGTIKEIGRVLEPSGALYVAVPDAATVTDKLYRWLARGGGHVNPFYSAPLLAMRIEQATGFEHRATRIICTSLSFLNRRNQRSIAPRRLLLLGGGTEISLRFLTWCFRLLDRYLGTRLSVYGWALYFGDVLAGDIDCSTWTNVCVRCGSATPSSQLQELGRVSRNWFGLATYLCPQCETRNWFTADQPRRTA
ncbi:MAG: class I SAM-dependent methyltransferase [Acidobacteriota bacterium]|nr:class I SAM-dependent methyltransferase [Acidobacteriota bacterium]